MEPSAKKQTEKKPPAATTDRKLRYDAPVARFPRPPHFLQRRDRREGR